MTEIREVAADEAAALVEDGAFLLDVREQEEWDAGHAPAAVHVPMSVISGRAADIPQDRLIVCVCRSGGRSAAVTEALTRGDWEAVNLAGGMEAWLAAGLEVVDDQGRPGHVI